MSRFGLFALPLVLAQAGCLSNPTIEVDRDSVDVPRGLSTDVLVTIDGQALDNLDEVLWSVDDPRIATVLPTPDRRRLRIGGDREGTTVVRVSSHGQTVAIETRVAPPKMMLAWIEPGHVTTTPGGLVAVAARALDSTFAIRDITHSARWTVRDPSLATLDHAGMMLQGAAPGLTSLHVTIEETAATAPITVFK
jgi:hypothetical protein